VTARCLALVLVVVAMLVAPNAGAHTVGISRGEYSWKDGTLYAGVSFARQEIAAALPRLIDNRGADDLMGFETHREDIGAWLAERLVVRAQGSPCTPSFGGMRFDGDGIALAVAYLCSGAADTLEIETPFLAELARGHRHLASLTSGDDVWQDVASSARTHLRFELTAPPAEQGRPALGPLFGMGLEHIFTGYDHLLFLFGLLLVGGPLRSLVAAVTAFTLAHSVTLGLAAFDVWAPSPRFIEPAIALSIAYIGIENWVVRDARGRWRITLPFGLVHGFGFAGALREIALPRDQMATAVFGFNLGVEIGQLAVLAVFLPLVLALRKTAMWPRIGMRVSALAIALTGLVWFVARLGSAS
jgi:hydrogenase/urease accessory protein HupE